MDHAEQSPRAAIQVIPDGRYEQEDIVEDDGCGNAVALPHDLEGFTRNLSALVVNQAGINASATCAHE